jgi:hypothetical protein
MHDCERVSDRKERLLRTTIGGGAHCLVSLAHQLLLALVVRNGKISNGVAASRGSASASVGRPGVTASRGASIADGRYGTGFVLVGVATEYHLGAVSRHCGCVCSTPVWCCGRGSGRTGGLLLAGVAIGGRAADSGAGGVASKIATRSASAYLGASTRMAIADECCQFIISAAHCSRVSVCESASEASCCHVCCVGAGSQLAGVVWSTSAGAAVANRDGHCDASDGSEGSIGATCSKLLRRAAVVNDVVAKAAIWGTHCNRGARALFKLAIVCVDIDDGANGDASGVRGTAAQQGWRVVRLVVLPVVSTHTDTYTHVQ